MRQRGRLTDWNDDRGFGFITPLGGGPTVFVHVSEFPIDVRRPMLNDLVTYELGQDERGRTRATDVLHLTPTAPRVVSSPRIPVALLAAGFIVVLIVLGAIFAGWSQVNRVRVAPTTSSSAGVHVAEPDPSASGDEVIAQAFRQQSSGVRVTGEGVVTKVLSDDNDGARHQRFIVRLASGQTLLVAHNIDIAPRLDSLAPGAVVVFNGEYAWNAQGGVIHWTHHDPSGKHQAGWLQYGGAIYQ